MILRFRNANRMQNIWCPTPVFLLFRRLVNVVSTLSISHHYLLYKSSQAHSDSQVAKPAHWLPWLNGNTSLGLSLSLQGSASQDDIPDVPPPRPQDPLHRLISSPALFDPVRKPRYPIVLCHGPFPVPSHSPPAHPPLQVSMASTYEAPLHFQSLGHTTGPVYSTSCVERSAQK